MALKQWHRVGLTAAGMALATAIALPPRPLPEQGEFHFLVYYYDAAWPARRFEYTLSGTLEALRLRVRAARMADSLLAAATGPRVLHSADGGITVLYSSAISTDSARVWVSLLERELALVPRGAGGGIPLIVRLRVGGSERELFGGGRYQDWRLLRFTSPRPDRPACLVDVRLMDAGTRLAERAGLIERSERTSARRARVLDWCMLYARFGMPGTRVARWAGRRVEPQYYWHYGPDFGWLVDMQRRGRTHEELAAFWSERLAGACSPHAGPCLRIVGLIDDQSNRWERYTVRRNSLLAGLMLRDPARFERFWRSPAPPAVALEQAYGLPAGEIVANYQREVARPEPSGPRLPPGVLLSSLGWAAVAIGLGLLVAWRQQVRP
jgi:hypothetical protein